MAKKLKDQIRDKDFKRKALTCSGVGCGVLLIILLSALIGGFIAIEGRGWLEQSGIINTSGDQNESGNGEGWAKNQDCSCTEVVDNVDKSRFINLYNEVSDGVVSIAIKDRRFANEDGDPGEIGTGFIVDSSGIIVTNNHVVESPDYEYLVVTKDGTEFTPEDIAMDVVNDIAVLKINPGDKQLKALKIGDSEVVQVGEEVAAIGSALGYSQSFTTGVVSGTDREISYRLGGSRVEYENTIQTDAAINPGNSGGPLLNLNGEVIGVNFLKMQYVDNMGFCLPINSIKTRISEYKEFGKFDLPFLGVKYQAVGYFDVLMDPDKVEGAEVVEVLSDSPADKAEIKVGDIITEVEDENVGGALNYFVQKYEVGETIEIEIFRDGEYQDVEVTLQSRHDFDLD